eukprot:NODE_240_length_11935_cov_0.818773.p2 type:complete len:507 gc:universal NODE_240_length_11935_cov_0.818773:4049-2529(-)
MLLQLIVWTASLNVFFDGTSNKPTSTTNIWKQFDAFHGEQTVYPSKYNGQDVITLEKVNLETGDRAIYISGIGTNKVGVTTLKVIGGYGMDSNVRVGYEFLVRNKHMVSEADFHLNVFGFSRGAATARMFANYVCDYGLTEANLKTNIKASILNRSYRSIQGDIRPKINILGLYDTVPSLTNVIPTSPVAKYSMDTTNPDILNVYHAIALNENRKGFEELPIDITDDSRTEEYYIGSHADIGGQGRKLKNPFSYFRSEIALQELNSWIAKRDIGFSDLFDQNKLQTEIPKSEFMPIQDSYVSKAVYKLSGKTTRTYDPNRLHVSVHQAMAKFEIGADNLAYTEFIKHNLNTPTNVETFTNDIVKIAGETPAKPKKPSLWDKFPGKNKVGNGDLSGLEGGGENGGGTKGGNDGKVGNDGQGSIDGNAGSDGKGGNDGKGGKGGMGDFNIPTVNFPSTNVPVDIPIDLNPGTGTPPTYEVPDFPIDGGYTGKPKVDPVEPVKPKPKVV